MRRLEPDRVPAAPDCVEKRHRLRPKAQVADGCHSYAGAVTTSQPGTSGRFRPVISDLALGLFVGIVLSILITLSRAGTGDSPQALAYVFAAGFGGILLLRRRLPVAVLVLSVLGTFAYYTLGFPPIGVALPVVAALFSAAEVGLLGWAVGSGAVVFGVSLYFRLRDDPVPLGYLLGTDALTNLALIAAAIALGYGVRSRLLRAAQQEQLARLTRDQAVRESELRAQVEREQISRDLHDTVGHALSVIALQASVGSEAVGRDDRAVGAALDRVREQSTSSLQELRSMVRLLRGGDDREGRHVRSLADVEALVAEAEGAGVRFDTALDVTVDELPAAVDAAAYRIIQESITNILRHAEATTATVRAGVEGGQLRITVSDDGRGAGELAGGHGLAGMTERARLLGGDVTTNCTPGKGFTVDATIPTRLAR